jgi:HPt (histidine-containing phosphotransfer) domain-containing protein
MPVVCNLERLENISMGDADFADELVQVFLDEASEQIEKLRAAVERADCQEAADVAHRLKGAGANIGAEILAAACQRLETAARGRALERLTEGFDVVDEEMNRVRSTFVSAMRDLRPR